MIDSTTVMDLCKTLPIHSGDVHWIAVHRDVIATTSGTSVIRVFNTSNLTEKSYSPLQVHKYHVIHCTITSDGKRLVSVSMDGKASIIDLDSGKLLAYHQQPSDIGMRTCGLSYNDQLLAVGACDGTIGVIEMDTYKTLKTMSIKDDESILALCFTPDTHYLLSGHSVTGDIRVWDAQYLTNKPVACQMAAHDLGTHYIQMSPKYSGRPGECRDGIQFASAGVDCMIYLWSITYTDNEASAPQLTKLHTLVGHTGPVYCVKYSNSGDELASCGADFTVRLWNLEGECVYVHLQAHNSFINSCAFSVDDAYIYTASCDRTVKVWLITDTYSLKDAPRADAIVSQNVVTRDADVSLIGFSLDPVKPQSQCRSVLDVASWTVDDVCQWLSGLGLGKLTESFRNNDIDGYELKQLNKDILEKELKISAFGARNKIMRGLEDLMSSAQKNQEASETNGCVGHEFMCPITHELMKEPVVASDGYSYERKAIESWIASGKTTSPMTNAPLPSDTLLPNHNLRMLIVKHCDTSAD